MEKETLVQSIRSVLERMKRDGYMSSTLEQFERQFVKIQRMAGFRGELYYTKELGETFVSQDEGTTCSSIRQLRRKCVQYLETYVYGGKIAYDHINHRGNGKPFAGNDKFLQWYGRFESRLEEKGLARGTRKTYAWFICQFLVYLQELGYSAPTDIRDGDVLSFIEAECRDHCRPTSLGAFLPGLRQFLKLSPETKRFLREVPEHVLRGRKIIEAYSEKEVGALHKELGMDDAVSKRDKAICLLALDGGLRGVDIRNLKLDDVDWKLGFLHIVQRKTRRPVNVPLSAAMGNALADYLLDERPRTESRFVFLLGSAPHKPMGSTDTCRIILTNAAAKSGIDVGGRSCGTRLTRHTRATMLLRAGTPLPVIAEALGHSSPDITMRYLSTDEEELSKCTLSLPAVGGLR